MSEKERPAATAIADRAGICTWTMSDTRLRRQRQCELIWQLGPRAVFELFDQLDRHHCLGHNLDRRLSRFAALNLKFYGPSEVINSRLPDSTHRGSAMRGAGSRAALFGEYEHLGWNLVPVRRGEKGCRTRGWPEGHFTAADFGPGDNIALRCAALLGDTADIDLDCAEALELADLYLPTTDIARGAIFEVFDDPLSHKDRTLLEIRADGDTGGAHLTLLPPSIADDERREWHGDVIDLVVVDWRILRNRAAWLAIGNDLDAEDEAKAIPPEFDRGERDYAEEPDEIPPRGWLLGNLLCRQFLTAIFGGGSTGKFALLFTMVLSLATGRPRGVP